MNDKNVDIRRVADDAAGDDRLLAQLMDGLTSTNETFRYNCHKALLILCEEHGEAIYPEWDRFVDLLRSDNSYRKMSAIHIIARLVEADTDERFSDVFDDFYGLLDDRSMIVAMYVASNSGRIVRSKPGLEPEITRRLLLIEETHHDQGRKDLVKGAAIEAFNEYFGQAGNRDGIISFVKEQLSCTSPKTRKAARSFLREWAGDDADTK